MVLYLENLPFLIFIVFLIVFLILKRKNLEIQGSFPIFYIFLYKTKLGINLMKKWSKKYKKIVYVFAYISFIIAIIGVFLSFIFMIWQTYFIYQNNIEVGGGLVLPLKTENGLSSNIPVFYIPFFEWIIALTFLAIVHEFAHGVVAKRFNIKIKSSGFAFFGIFLPLIPAAFVEPDEKQLKKSKFFEKVSLLGAGSTSNFIFGIIFLVLFLGANSVNSNISHIDKIEFSGISNKSDLNKYNITKAELVKVNDIEKKEDMIKYLRNLSNETLFLTLKTDNEIQKKQINTFLDNDKKYKIGIYNLNIENKAYKNYEIIYMVVLFLTKVLFWIWFLNIMIGFANLLPLWITDGGQILLAICEKYFSQNIAYKINNFFSWATLILIIFTLWPKLLKFFF